MTVYIGTSAFAANLLGFLAATEYRPQLVITKPDRPAGRGKKLTSPPVAHIAAELGLTCIQPETLSDEAVLTQIAECHSQHIVVCAYGALIREPLLSRYEILNVHPSLLPRWRGAAPIERAMMAGDQTTGVSIMRLTAGLDSGPICASATEPIHPDDDYQSLTQRLEKSSFTLLVNVLHEPRDFHEQPEVGITYAEKITADDRTLALSAPAEQNERIVCALHPHIGARVKLDDQTFLRVLRARVDDTSFSQAGDSISKNFPFLKPLKVVEERLFFGQLELLEVQPPGGRPMSAESWVRGKQ